jgi:hypothetical protein
MHLPIWQARLGIEVCFADGKPWSCPNVDAYWLPKGDAEFDFTDSPECVSPPHRWGPWVLSPVYGNREDRFCIVCGIMEMQTVEP